MFFTKTDCPTLSQSRLRFFFLRACRPRQFRRRERSQCGAFNVVQLQRPMPTRNSRDRTVNCGFYFFFFRSVLANAFLSLCGSRNFVYDTPVCRKCFESRFIFIWERVKIGDSPVKIGLGVRNRTVKIRLGCIRSLYEMVVE